MTFKKFQDAYSHASLDTMKLVAYDYFREIERLHKALDQALDEAKMLRQRPVPHD